MNWVYFLKNIDSAKMMKMLLLSKLSVVASGGRVVRHPIKGENVPGKVKNFLQKIADKPLFSRKGSIFLNQPKLLSLQLFELVKGLADSCHKHHQQC